MDSDAINARHERFTNTFEARLKQHRIGRYASPPSLLYHYTTAEGVKGIIENDEIWATNFRYVNDLTEFIYANDILREEIRHRLSSATPLVRAVLDAIMNTPDHLVGEVDIYIACFCEKGDLLSQWRAYGGRGGGYAIGLGGIKLDVDLAGSKYEIHQVNYDEAKQKVLIRFLFDEFCAAVEDIGVGINPDSIAPPVIYSSIPAALPMQPALQPKILSDVPEPLGGLCLRLAFAFLELACCFKSPSFAIEEEWRLVNKRFSESTVDPGRVINLRVSGATLIPYVKLPLFLKDHPQTVGIWNFSLEKIMYGPGLNPRGTERSLQYLTRVFPHSVAIEQSGIKVRV